jgi:conjugal transfer pilus assembly protein TraB
LDKIRIPFYSDLPPRQQQWVHMALGGIGLAALYLAVSALIGGDPMTPSNSTAAAPPVKTLGAVPGENVDPQAAWIGGAGKTITTLQADVQAQQQRQDKVNQDLLRELEELRRARGEGSAAMTAATAVGSQPLLEEGASNSDERLPKAPASAGLPPPQRQAGPGNLYPPGQPIGAYAPPPAAALPAEPPVGVIKLSLARSGTATAEGNEVGHDGKPTVGASGQAKKEVRKVDSFLPVSFTRAVLLGGMDAPTGGQAQRDPVPVLLKLSDNAFLPNAYRSAVKDCFVVAEGFGEVSAERAYIRTQLLSCVLKNGQSLEVPIKGSVFGEDGKNGMRGRLITKQGAILTNALLSGIASGIGQGFAASTQVTSVSPLGSTTSSSSASQDILKSGLGTGVARAMDRLAQYYINLAERTFPVIEIDAGRMVDIVITQGVTLDGTLAISAEGGSAGNGRTINRSALLSSVNEDSND